MIPGKKIKLFTAILIVMSSMIGTGVFTTLGYQLLDIHSCFGIIMLWLVGGIIALCGALCYGELASAMPRSGGEYHYLSEIFHPFVGFLSGWVSATVAFAAPIALSAMAFGNYMTRVFPSLNPELLAASIIIIVTFIHSFSLHQSSAFQNFFTVINIVLILFFIASGFGIHDYQDISLLPRQSFVPGESWHVIFSSSFAVSLIFVSYSYSGWNTATYIANDIENPGHNVPRSLMYGTLIVTVLYILLNYIFLYSAPSYELKGQVEVGLISAIHIFGLKTGNFMGIMISLLLVASISSFVIAGPRVAQVMGEDLPQLSFLSLKNKHGVPYMAKIIQGIISLLLIFTHSFLAVLLYIGFTLSLITFLTVFGLFVLRIRNKGVVGGYRTFGYPVTPVIFLALTAWMLFFTFRKDPLESCEGLATILAGSIIYYIKNIKSFFSNMFSNSKKVSLFSVALLCVTVIYSCKNKAGGEGATVPGQKNQAAVNKPAEPRQKNDYDSIKFDRTYNDIARFIAGMPGDSGSPYIALERDSGWVRFHRNFDNSWNQIETKRLDKMAEWGKTELAKERSSGLDVFYPLSGPDILHANVLFPGAKNYRLYALEPNGALPDLRHFTGKETGNYLDNINASLEDIFKRSYFITHKMNAQLTASKVYGSLPLICIFLVRTGNEIINIQYFRMNEDGSETALSKDSSGNNYDDLVKVYFKKEGRDSIHAVYPLQMVSYMKGDLSDEAYKKNTGLKNYFSRMKPCITYIKSASYLLHYNFFSSMRDIILSKSQSILEDDTGIPFKDFTADIWDITLYGKYVTPVKDFSGVFQPDLLKAYQDTVKSKPKPLPFSLGYHWGTNDQNLLKAERRQ